MKKRAKRQRQRQAGGVFVILLPAVVLLLPLAFLSHSFFRVLGLSLAGIALLLLLALLPDLIRKAKAALLAEWGRHTRSEWLTRAALVGGLLLNLAYAAFGFFFGVVGDIPRLCAEALYYLSLSAARFSLFEQDRRLARVADAARRENLGWQAYRRSGRHLLLLSAAALAMVVLVLGEGRVRDYPAPVVPVVVLFTLWRAASALFHLFRFRRRARPVLSAVKLFSFSSALLSAFALQCTLLGRYGGDFRYRFALNALTGLGVTLALFAIGALAILRARRHLKK